MEQTMLLTYTTHEEFARDFLRRINASTYWTDDQVSSLTSLLADCLGDLGVTNSYATMIAAREAFIRLARRQSSVLECARFLGVDIARKTCPRVTARILNTSKEKVVAQKHTRFTVDGTEALLDDLYIWEAGEVKEVGLKLGYLDSITMRIPDSVGDYYKVVCGWPNFEATKEVEVSTSDPRGVTTQFIRHEGSMFTVAPNNPVFLDVTENDGQLSIQFGSKQFGLVPQAGFMLTVSVVCSTGSRLNNDLKDQIVKSPDVPLQGKTTTNIAGGSDEKELDYYRIYAPTRARTDKIITKAEWKAATMLYPDVGDCQIMSQADIAPNDKQWQGVIRICVLPKSVSTWGGINPNPKSAQWDEFIRYMKKYGSPLDIQTWNPTKLQVDVSLTVALFRDARGTIESNEDAIREAVTSLTSRSIGSLGKRFSVSTIIDAVKYDNTDPDNPKKREDVDYCTVESPSQDIIPRSILEHVVIRNLNINMVYSDRNRQ